MVSARRDEYGWDGGEDGTPSPPPPSETKLQKAAIATLQILLHQNGTLGRSVGVCVYAMWEEG